MGKEASLPKVGGGYALEKYIYKVEVGDVLNSKSPPVCCKGWCVPFDDAGCWLPLVLLDVYSRWCW